jgi:hypothetical protein
MSVCFGVAYNALSISKKYCNFNSEDFELTKEALPYEKR